MTTQQAFLPLLNQILSSAPLITKVKTLCLISNIAENSLQDTMLILSNRGILNQLLEYVQTHETTLKNEAFYVFAFLMATLADNQGETNETGAIRQLNQVECQKSGLNIVQISIDFLGVKSNEYKTQQIVLYFLKNLFNCGQENCELFDQMGGVDVLLEMQYSENKEIYNLVLKLLTTYFNDAVADDTTTDDKATDNLQINSFKI